MFKLEEERLSKTYPGGLWVLDPLDKNKILVLNDTNKHNQDIVHYCFDEYDKQMLTYFVVDDENGVKVALPVVLFEQMDGLKEIPGDSCMFVVQQDLAAFSCRIMMYLPSLFHPYYMFSKEQDEKGEYKTILSVEIPDVSYRYPQDMDKHFRLMTFKCKILPFNVMEFMRLKSELSNVVAL